MGHQQLEAMSPCVSLVAHPYRALLKKGGIKASEKEAKTEQSFQVSNP